MNPDTPFSALALRELKAAAAVTAQPIQAVEARSADQVVTGVEAAAKVLAHPVTLEDALLVSTRRQIADRAITTRLRSCMEAERFPRRAD